MAELALQIDSATKHSRQSTAIDNRALCRVWPATVLSTWRKSSKIFSRSAGLMPMPVSATAMATVFWPPAASTRIVTEPFGVNFRALLRRFSTICLTFCRSLRIGPTLGDTWLLTVSFARAMMGSISATTSAMSSGSVKRVSWSGMRPASIRVRSRISLMIPTRCRPFELIRSRLFLWPL